MKRPLQSFSFRSSGYERPNQPWICGKTARGRACKRGPDGKGRCHTLQECEPRRQSDEWVCGRPPESGGACAEGPLSDGRCCRRIPPCTPVRSLRSRRGRVVAWVASLSLALLLLTFGGTLSRDLIYPGDVNIGHSQVGDCSNCHVAFEGGPVVWLHAAFVSGNPADDSRKCLACHDRGAHALTPHNLAPAELTSLTRETREARDDSQQPWAFTVSDALFSLPEEAADSLACAACHKEHEGENAPLTQVSDARCQSCHSGRFGSFAEAHPDFGDYPYLRRTRLVFDHEAHNRKHFPETKDVKPPETCAHCHLPDSSGRFMLVRSFDDTCATCHSDDINGDSLTGPKGIAFIAIPGLDLETLAERGKDVGDWSDLALAEEIPPFTRVLLSADATLAADLDQVRDLDLQDLGAADDAQLDAVVRIAWAIKELLFDLTLSGAEGFQSRVEASLSQSIDPKALGPLLGHIPRDVVKAAAQTWFPRLNRDVTEHRERRSTWILQEGRSLAGSVSLGDESYLWQRAMAVLVGQSGQDNLSDDQILAIDDDAVHPDDELLFLDEEGNPGSSPPGPVVGESEGPAPAVADAEEPGEVAAEETESKSEESAVEEPAVAETTEAVDDADGETEDAGEAADAEKAEARPEPAIPEPEPEDVAARAGQSTASAPVPEPEEDIEVASVDPEAWAKTGGWYRRDDVLYYRPIAHKDPFLQAWFDVATMPASASVARHSESIFAVLEHKDTPGKCSKCHSVERADNGALTVNWRPFAPKAEESAFTMFVHTTHFSVLGDDGGCTTCHELDPQAKYLDSYKNRDPVTPVSNFAPLKRAVCVDCHVEQSAGEACTLCHRYHIGDFTAKPLATRMAELAPDASQGGAKKPSQRSEPSSPWLALADKMRTVASVSPADRFVSAEGEAPQLRASDDKLAMLLRPEVTDPSPDARASALFGFELPWKSAPIDQSAPNDVRAIHLSSHRTQGEAAEERARLQDLFRDLLPDSQLSIQEVDLGERGVFFRVRSGPYQDRRMAEAYCAELKRRKQDCLVTAF